MKLEDQVCSLELAKRLKELGVKQESVFYWFDASEDGKYVLEYEPLWQCTTCDFETGCRCYLKDLASYMNGNEEGYDSEIAYSAFTVAELGEMLPIAFKFGKNHVRLRIENFGEPMKWRYQYMIEEDCGQYPNSRFPLNAICEETEADARAKMLIHLIEKGLVKP